MKDRKRNLKMVQRRFGRSKTLGERTDTKIEACRENQPSSYTTRSSNGTHICTDMWEQSQIFKIFENERALYCVLKNRDNYKCLIYSHKKNLTSFKITNILLRDYKYPLKFIFIL